MPRVDWGVSRREVDAFDRDSQYKPYNGPLPPGGRVYNWRIKLMEFAAKTDENHARLTVGLELVPRTRDEQKYSTYFVRDFIAITNKTQFRYVPLLDALGVSTQDFLNKTMVKEDGTITRIGSYKQDGEFIIGAMLKTDPDNEDYPRKIGAYTDAYVPDDEDLSDEDIDEVEEYDEELDPDEYEDDDEASYEDEDEDEEELEDEPVRTRKTARPRKARPTARGRRH